jgi:hypothetical protein
MWDEIRVAAMQLCRLSTRPRRNSIQKDIEVNRSFFLRQVRKIVMNYEHVLILDPIQISDAIQKRIPVLAEISIRRFKSFDVCLEKLKLTGGSKSVYDANEPKSPQLD